MRNQAITLVACLGLAVIGCGEDSGKDIGSIVNTGELSVADGSKADSIGNRRYDTFGGSLTFGGEPKVADIQGYGYRVAYTFRAKRRGEIKVSASGVDGTNSFDTVIAVYGPKNRAGNYPYVGSNDDSDYRNNNLSSVLKFNPPGDGIYLMLVTAYGAGQANVGMSCGSPNGCDLPCAVIRLYRPVCGVDDHTYGNSQEAACTDVPIAHEGTCAPSCDNTVCGEGEHCELQEVQCITTPCYPQPTCVADDTAPSCATVLCAPGTRCEEVQVQCIRAPCPAQVQCVPLTACATVRCASGTQCVDHGDGTASCEPACKKTGCSGQICSDQDIVSTCEFRPEYACYDTATCERQADGQCGWTATAELNACLGQ